MGKAAEGTLNPQEQAIAHSLRRMIEEHLYWPIIYAQWIEDPAWELCSVSLNAHHRGNDVRRKWSR
jgi:hypothetical protein